MTTALQIPMSDYVHDNVGAPVPTLSSSLAHRLLTRSPLHAWTKHPRLNPEMVEETSDVFDLGTAVHAVLLEGRDDLLAVGKFADWRTNAAKDFRDEARAEGKIPLLPDQARMVQRMAQSARLAIATCPDLEGCTPYDAERTFVYQHEGTWLRCRPDLMARDGSVIISYKTTGTNAAPEKFARTLLDMGYDMQAAFEINGVASLTRHRPAYLWCVQEVTPPFAVSFLGLSKEVAAYAEDRLDQAVNLWQRCLESDNWPGYPERAHYFDLPPWVRAQWEEDIAS